MSETPDRGYDQARRIDLAFQVMNYNQGFVMFVDGKANTLLLVNSIILATSASASVSGSRVALAALAAGTVAILLCLSVVFARQPRPAKRDKARLAFYAHIVQRSSWTQYQHDLEEVEPEQLLASLAHQVHDLAAVVDRKFAAYARAQTATFVAAGLWIASMAVPVLRSL